MKTSHTLDTRGLLCPMPVIRTQNMIQTLQPGDTLLVEATDPGVMHDIPAWCRINGHRILDKYQEDKVFCIYIEVQEEE
ncbi:MAG: sulfurtransferase TusA family protein [Ketobacteraceae bacterium]|nr:sulfurtransferase TusA family protein [Ketobacteraceae bacterium]